MTGNQGAGPAEPPTGNYFELIYADIATFGKAPPISALDARLHDVTVYGVPWDATASARGGARLGPRRIREQSGWFSEVWNPQSTPLIAMRTDGAERKQERFSLADAGDVRIAPMDVVETASNIRTTSSVVSADSFPVMIGGDHYVTFPAYQGVCDALQGQRVGLIHVDAHNDLIDEDPVFGKHWDGTPIRRCLEFASLDPRALAQVGLRGFIGAAEREFQLRNGVTVIGMEELRELGVNEVARQAVGNVLEHCDVIYLTVDIDAVDPSCAPGVCTPFPGGLLSAEFLALLRALGGYPAITALDIVEVAPPLDPTGQTPLLAAHAIFAFLEERFLY